MRSRRIPFAVLIVLAVQIPSAGSGETLADAIALAYRSNPTLASHRYDVRAADEDVVQARSELRPTADFEAIGEYDRTVEGRTTSAANPFSPTRFDQNSDQAQIVVTQPLYTGGKATADRASAEAGVRANRAVLRSAEGDLLLEVITAYVDVRRYDATLQVWNASVTELGKLTKEISARQQAGELTRTDIAQAESQLAIAREQVVASEQAVENTRGDYAALVGRDPGALDEAPPLPQVPADVTTAFDLAQKRSPELAQTIYTEQASRENIVAARAAGRPTISLRGTAGLSGEAVPYRLRDQDQAFAASVVFTQPLSAGGRTASQIRQAEDRNGSDRLKIEAARRELLRSISAAWNQMVTTERASRLLEDQRRAAITQLDGMISEYRVGLRSTFDVLYAQQSLRDAQVALLASRRDSYVAEATLLRQTGLLEVESILTGAELYEPSDHMRQVENKNALPWDGAIMAIDTIAKPVARRKPLVSPAASAAPAMAPARSAPSGDAPLSRTLPITPLPATGSPR